MKNCVKMRFVLGLVLVSLGAFIGEAKACHNGVGDDCPAQKTGAQTEGTCAVSTDEDGVKDAATRTTHTKTKHKGSGSGHSAKGGHE